ncbi:MAG: hypothetical protein HUU20_11390 [Pirellulales bacterium]|nr:hypothetical protein [Pirellulales bacterium]
MDSEGGWILEVDIRKFFDTLDHAHLREFLQRRVCDGVLRRLIGKWLKAGVMEEGSISYPEAGSPQGGVISPLVWRACIRAIRAVLLSVRREYGVLSAGADDVDLDDLDRN